MPRTWLTTKLRTSGPQGWNEAQIRRVKEMGVKVPPPDSGFFALVQALSFDPETGQWTAVSEPDGEGTAAGLAGGPAPQG